ncbi:MAG: prepilin-type N-terminal cleavage/methylation domain-containing protein, partial [Pseudomonadales bacterium]|nr:prepilin-type N-terminal cleavage/methylation domain-containing protein [Pseudomonadales bacterium]
ESTSQGYTLLEVLVAALLVAIPVAAAQMLMLRSAATVASVQDDAHARYAASHFVARVAAFHLGGLWPDSAVSPGQWLRSIDMELSADDLPVSPPQCINRWCSASQWADFESAYLICVLNVQLLGDFCTEVMAISHHAVTDGHERIAEFNIRVRAGDNFAIVIEWPGHEASQTSSGMRRVTLGDAS